MVQRWSIGDMETFGKKILSRWEVTCSCGEFLKIKWENGIVSLRVILKANSRITKLTWLKFVSGIIFKIIAIIPVFRYLFLRIVSKVFVFIPVSGYLFLRLLYIIIDFRNLFLYIFRRAEWSLFARGHVKMISFFPVRDIPLRFFSLNVICSARFGRIYPIFVFSTDQFFKNLVFRIRVFVHTTLGSSQFIPTPAFSKTPISSLYNQPQSRTT